MLGAEPGRIREFILPSIPSTCVRKDRQTEIPVKRSLIFLLVLWSLILPVSAQAAIPQARRAAGATAAAPAPAPRPDAELLSKVLPNGLEVIVVQDHSIPLVNIELAVKNGSYTEPPELNGLSHLYEHMFFKRNAAIASDSDYLRTIGQMGIAYNGSTREEVVNYYFNTTSPNLRTAMQYMRDSVRYPLFEKEEFEKEREVVLGEFDRNESNPFYFLTRAVTNRLFYQYPSRKDPLGNRQTISTATTDMMRLIQSRYYVPNNSALVVTGDVKPDEIYAMAQELFGDWPKREKDPFVEFPLVEHPPLKKSEAAIIKQPVQNVIVQIGWQGPSIGKDNAATYAADVFSFILRQPNSRFQRDLVDSGLVQIADLSYYTQRNVGPISLTIATTPDKAKAAVAAIHNEVAHFTDKDYFTDEQLENAKLALESDDLFSREKLSEYAHTLSFWWASTGIDYFRGYLPTLRRTSRADINRYVTTYIQGKPHVSVVLISASGQTEAQLTEEELIGK